MKTVNFFLIIFLTLTKCSEDAKTFLHNLLYYAQGNTSIELNEECLGKTFDEDLQNLYNYTENNNYKMVLNVIEKIAEEIYTFCPINTALSLFNNSYNSMTSFNFISGIINKISKISNVIINELKANNYNIESIGKSIGQIIYYINQNESFRFENSNIGYEITEGVIDGLTKNKTESKCKDSIIKGKDDLMNLINEIVEGFRNPKEDSDIFTNIILKLFGISGLFSNCRLFYFMSVFKNFISLEGFDNVIERINGNSTILLENAKELIKANDEKNYHYLGEVFGNMIKIALDFYVE